ncbi:hypothetical protein ACFWUY_41985, partial [Streptomyces sp. NPDC058664]
HRSDQYSLGCTLFTLLTGESPFPADNPGAVVAAHLTKPVPRAAAVVGDLPPGIDEVIARAMAKDPAERFSSCSAFAHAATAASASGTPQPAGHGGGLEGAVAMSAPGTLQPGGQERWSARTEVGAPGRTLIGPPDSAQQPSAQRATAAEPVSGVSVSSAGSNMPTTRAVPQVRSEPLGSARPHRAVSSRWRVLAVSLIVLAMVAGVGVIGVGAIYWKFVRPNRMAPAPNWGEHASVAAGFTELIPSGPTGRGWREATCFATPSLVVLPGDPAPLRQITCTDVDGRTAWYTEFPTTADADAYLTRHTTEDTTRELPGTSVTAYRPRDPAAPFTLAAREHSNPLSANTVVE